MAARAMVSVSTGAMNSVLSKLAALLEDEHNPRVRNSIIALRCALISMRSFLEKMSDKEDIDPLVEGWMKQVRDMTYDLEDCIDDYMRSAAPGDTNSTRVAQLLKMVKSRRQYASLLQQLKERVCEASDRRSRYEIVCDPGDQMELLGSPSMPSNAVPIDRRLPVFGAPPGHGLVGVDGPRDRLIKLLAPDGHQQLKMVSIVGSRGIGKTTLAMEVYRSLKGRFDCHTVVSVSRRHDLRMILRSILSQVSEQEFDFTECDEGQLIDKLREFLKFRRYLFIIEDIWDASVWKIIRWAFPENGCGSRILVTTCIISIARSCCYLNEDHIIQMTLLGDAEARKLFFRRIFHPEYCCPPHLEKISYEILKKCGGLPLTILTIASLLAMKSEEVKLAIKSEEVKLAMKSEWMRVRDCIGSALDKSVTLEGMKQILYFAYYDLPFHLRTCLLYLSIFPENYVIDKARLIRRWMAEGFIIEELGKSPEEVGECYFNELINRGLIQPVGIQYNGRIEACQVHSTILDLIISKSAEENFVIIYDGRGCNFGLQDTIRRLSLYCDYDQEGIFIPSAVTASHIRSLTIFMTNKKMPTLEKFRALRVLDLEISGELEDANYLQNIERLYLLKYLRLQTTRFIVLPEQVVELQFLQTLDLTRALIRRLPCSIHRLKQLNYLLVKNVKLPDGIEKLQVLQELSHVEIESSNSPNSLEKLGRLTKLRVLGINWCISDTDTCMKICVDNLVSSLNKLGTSNLQSLHIGSGSGCSLDFLLDSLSAPFLLEFRMTSDYHFPRIPEWMISLASLTLLEINIDTVGEEVLEILGRQLPSLLVLLLSVKWAAPKQGLIIRSTGFQCLKQFDFICWKSWAMLVFKQGSMLALEKLQLKFLAKGACVHNGFQFGIEHITSLKHLHVDIGCKDAETREVEAAEEAIRSAVSSHPSHPRLVLRRWWEEELIPAEGWGIKAAGWVVSPIISELLRKGFSFLSIDISEKLKQLELKVVQLERMLRLQAVEIFPHRNRVEPLLEYLKSAFYEAEDILDDVEYHRLEGQIQDDKFKLDILDDVEYHNLEGQIQDDEFKSDIWDDKFKLHYGVPPRKRDLLKKNLQSATPSSPLNDQETSLSKFSSQETSMSKKKLKDSLEKIEDIINNTCKLLERLNLSSATNRTGCQDVAPSVGSAASIAAPPLKVIGREEDRDKIIAMLHEKEGDGQPSTSNSGLCYSVIGIHGIAGSGKSTLAQIVYASEKKEKQEKRDGHFDLVMWVHVSRNFRTGTIFRQMLHAATGNTCHPSEDVFTIQKMLEHALRNKRFLLVLDDVWCDKDILELLSHLEVGKRGSKILVTTRNKYALSDLGPNVRYTTIPVPDFDDTIFFELFMYYALKDGQDRSMFENIGAEIAKKLKGSPLAASVVGGQLRKRQDVDYWNTVRDQNILNGSTTGALWWSYQHLGDKARRCFAYCNIFPRTNPLYRDELVNLWLAEGFVRNTNEGEEMEDVGQECFDELVSASFLQPGGKDFKGKDYYLVHDLLHDLAETVGGDCFRIENELRWRGEEWTGDVGEEWTGDVPRDVRHLFVQNYELVTEKIFELENLRTLIIYTVLWGITVEEKVIESIFKRLPKLRVLYLSLGWYGSKWSLPESISQLKHLRYLAVRIDFSHRVILPSALTKLHHMQLVDVSQSRELEFSSGNHINLRHVFCDRPWMILNIGGLTSLQTLPSFRVGKEKGSEIKQLRDLNKLRGSLDIRGLGNVKSKEEALEANLAAKERLTKLILDWNDATRCSPDIEAEVLEGLCPPMGLETLHICGYNGSRFSNWLVGKQSGGPKNLQTLLFAGCSQLGPAPRLEAFIHLRSLCLSNCSWDALPGNMEHLTSLKELRIYECLNIRSLPTLPLSLEKVTLRYCHYEFMESCQIIGHPNWQKIEHIPTKEWEI